MKIGILGANGFLGQALCKQFPDAVQITRNTYRDHVHEEVFDVFINANGNSRKYWAEEHPNRDFVESVVSVMNTFADFKIKKYIYISSSDVYGDSFYGFHKKLAEQIVKKNSSNYIILRCSAMIGEGMKKGVVQDLIDETPLWLTRDSEVQFITVNAVAEAVINIIWAGTHNDTIDIGGEKAVSINEIAEILGVKYTVRPDALTYRRWIGAGKLSNIYPVKTSKQYIQEFANERMDKSV